MSALAAFGPFVAAEWQRRGGRFLPIPGKIHGANHSVGHRIRDRENGSVRPITEKHVPILIIGGGISGLSAAWWLRKNRFSDFHIVEMAEKLGGNSISGANQVSRYPWGAHYVPIPNSKSKLVFELFSELGVIKGYDKKGRPYFNEDYLCHDPEERLFINGHWQEGLIPHHEIAKGEQDEIKRFIALMKTYQSKIGRDGRPYFTIPMELSSNDPEVTRLDDFSMAEYLKMNQFSSPALLWYVNYCCRDDFGSNLENTSAWASIHYFSSRGGPNANSNQDDSHAVLTWPEGNSWIVDRLREQIPNESIQSHSLVTRISQKLNHVEADVVHAGNGESIRFYAKSIIFAAPRFVAGHVIEDWQNEKPGYLSEFSYAPWMVANVTLIREPQSQAGFPLCWDNVQFGGKSLGYVVATHQHKKRYSGNTVITVYFPLTDKDPKSERKAALSKSHADWMDLVVSELESVHPGISVDIESIDTWIWGHGMIRPTPGFIWGKARQEALLPLGRMFFANSDMSGISIFEEAQYRGVKAAEQALQLLRKPAYG